MLMEYPFPGNVRELENLVESAFYMAQGIEIHIVDFPPEISQLKGKALTLESASPIRALEDSRQPTPASARPLLSEEKEQAIVLFRRMKQENVSFWRAVKEPFMKREISRELVREVIKIGLEESKGRYKDLLEPFHLQDSEYTVFMNFLKKHSCQVDYKPYRQRISTA
jgi:DNA-binding NtrC family response regulator